MSSAVANGLFAKSSARRRSCPRRRRADSRDHHHHHHGHLLGPNRRPLLLPHPENHRRRLAHFILAANSQHQPFSSPLLMATAGSQSSSASIASPDRRRWPFISSLPTIGSHAPFISSPALPFTRLHLHNIALKNEFFRGGTLWKIWKGVALAAADPHLAAALPQQPSERRQRRRRLCRRRRCLWRLRAPRLCRRVRSDRQEERLHNRRLRRGAMLRTRPSTVAGAALRTLRSTALPAAREGFQNAAIRAADGPKAQARAGALFRAGVGRRTLSCRLQAVCLSKLGCVRGPHRRRPQDGLVDAVACDVGFSAWVLALAVQWDALFPDSKRSDDYAYVHARAPGACRARL